MPTTLAAAARPAIGRRSELDSLSGMKPALVAGSNETGLVRDDHGLRAVAALELREHVRDMRLDRVDGHDELVRDLLIRAASCHQPEDLGLALGQRGHELGSPVAGLEADGVQ